MKRKDTKDLKNWILEMDIDDIKFTCNITIECVALR